ncbi:MAG: uroporphyrinogen-III C-methyltransferase, partial [Haloplanus sp.]
EVVPGITSAVAAPGVAGIPPTHRDHASTLAVVTGHEDPTKEDSALDWDALSGLVTAGGTLVILMGVGRLPDNAAALRAAGVDADTPVAMIERATLADERVVTGTLDTIIDIADAAGIDPPAVTVVGDVVGVRETVARCLGGGDAMAEASVATPPVVGVTDSD